MADPRKLDPRTVERLRAAKAVKNLSPVDIMGLVYLKVEEMDAETLSAIATIIRGEQVKRYDEELTNCK